MDLNRETHRRPNSPDSQGSGGSHAAAEQALEVPARDLGDFLGCQAAKLGDEASAKQRFGLAADYYGVAREEQKAQAARDKQQKLAMARMQPSIDQMQKQAEQMRAQFSDPQKVKEMQEQARAMQKQLQARQQANAKPNAGKADDLEKELGL